MAKNNTEIRNRLEEFGITHWRLAEKMGITPSWLSVKLRKEFSDAEKQRVLAIIRELAAEEAC